PPPGGESFAEAGERFGRCVRAILAGSRGDVAVVAHAGVIRAFCCELLARDVNTLLELPQPCGGVTTLRCAGDALSVESVGVRPESALDEAAIRSLYRRFDTPEGVQEHMRAVADCLEALLAGLDGAYDAARLRRAALVHPDLPLRLTLDRRGKQALGLVESAGEPLPVAQIERVLRGDPRLLQFEYDNGDFLALLDMGEEWEIPHDSAYRMRIRCRVPVDEKSDPEIHLATYRQICSNGQVAEVAAFRSKMQIKDKGGAHFARLLSSFSNPQGVETMRSRLLAAQATKASVGELLSLDGLLREALLDRREQMLVRETLMERAGNPCVRYGVADLSSIGQKKRSLLPVECSVADLLNMGSEISTHHARRVRSGEAGAFDAWAGETLAKPFDLEDLYGNAEAAEGRYFDRVDWDGALL
ncbi:MAG: histidine phosphatase family protein, partial [Kiritimatiellae bacterium]|nr:histidine phosphatase family protein [Kiritimatiellia bacterium]